VKLPRDISGKELVKALERQGYKGVRHKGSHVYLTIVLEHEHHLAVPLHNPLSLELSAVF
jgi:predicted RNA binding protein YcfA (HicA-like mRNA interferase family)